MTYSSSIEFLNFNNWPGWPGHYPGRLFDPKTLNMFMIEKKRKLRKKSYDHHLISNIVNGSQLGIW
jgi:hypothetical protein